MRPGACCRDVGVEDAHVKHCKLSLGLWACVCIRVETTYVVLSPYIARWLCYGHTGYGRYKVVATKLTYYSNELASCSTSRICPQRVLP